MWKKIIIKFYFYCTKIRALLRTSLMFLWELKNAIISTTLRELCDIKNPPTMASTSSATYYFITRCLSLSKAASKKPHNFITSSPRKIPHTVASTSSATNSSITRCLSLPKAHYFYCIKICVLSRTSMMFLWELNNAIISQNLRELCVIKNL